MTSTSESKGLTWPFHRSSDDMLLAGVAGGIALRLGIRSVYVRAAFMAASLFTRMPKLILTVDHYLSMAQQYQVPVIMSSEAIPVMVVLMAM